MTDTAPTPTFGQSQAQQQQQQVTINFQNSSDPKLELKILNQMHSAGRQLGRISAVIEVLLAAVDGSSALATESGSAAVNQFRKMIQEIEKSKAHHSIDYFIAQLEALRRDDPAAYTKTESRLRAFLDPPATNPVTGATDPATP
jgi:hypothetical protein